MVPSLITASFVGAASNTAARAGSRANAGSRAAGRASPAAPRRKSDTAMVDAPRTTKENLANALEIAHRLLDHEPSDDAVAKVAGEDEDAPAEPPSWEEIDAKDEELRALMEELKKINDENYDHVDEALHIQKKCLKTCDALEAKVAEVDELYLGQVADKIAEIKKKEAEEAADGGAAE